MHVTDNGLHFPATAMQELEALALERHARGKVVLELGAEYGFSTILMGRVAEKVVSVDWHRGYTRADIGGQQDTLLQYMYNIKEVRDRVVPIVGRFEDVLPHLAPATFDVVFQDGGHEWESTYFAFSQAMRLVKPGGLLITHDYDHPLCAERAVCDALGLRPRIPVVGTLALFDM